MVIWLNVKLKAFMSISVDINEIGIDSATITVDLIFLKNINTTNAARNPP
jgi:hypothetical protein